MKKFWKVRKFVDTMHFYEYVFDTEKSVKDYLEQLNENCYKKIMVKSVSVKKPDTMQIYENECARTAATLRMYKE